MTNLLISRPRLDLPRRLKRPQNGWWLTTQSRSGLKFERAIFSPIHRIACTRRLPLSRIATATAILRRTARRGEIVASIASFDRARDPEDVERRCSPGGRSFHAASAYGAGAGTWPASSSSAPMVKNRWPVSQVLIDAPSFLNYSRRASPDHLKDGAASAARPRQHPPTSACPATPARQLDDQLFRTTFR